MVYSNTPYEQKESDFPPPPMYLSWMNDWDYRQNQGKGQIRHHDSLKSVRRYVGRWTDGAGRWYRDWAIYEWDGKKYVLLYEGRQNQLKADTDLFDTPLKGGVAPAREADPDDIDAAIASILGGAA